MRNLLVVATVVLLIALAGAIVRTARAITAPPPIWNVAEGAARTRGIRGFAVTHEAPRALDVVIDGVGSDGRLRVRADAAEVVQRLDARGARWLVRTRRDAIELDRAREGEPDGERDRTGGARATAGPRVQASARRGARGWLGAPLDADAAEALGRIVALDGALAVQGSSLVFGDAYVACTVRCSAAEACLERAPRELARCADDVVVCAACLERAP